MSGMVSETRTYNSLLQLTSIVRGSTYYQPAMNVTYQYSATQNNGKILSQTDGMSGEQVSYTYDALLRLASAQTATKQNVTQWGQSFSYDGFGNLTDVTTIKGTAPEMHTGPFSPATNRASSMTADANGNIVGNLYYIARGYDVENRLVSYVNGNYYSPAEVKYGYAPDNKRVFRWYQTYDGSGNLTGSVSELTLWGVNGQKLATFNIGGIGAPIPSQVGGPSTTNLWFGGRLALKNGASVSVDNLGSRGKYYPYGGERGSSNPANGQEKFATYTRDAETGLDYADQRYYQPGTGMFLSPDPSNANVKTSDPRTWNRYSYVNGDPISNTDPSGLGGEEEDTVDDGEWPGPLGKVIVGKKQSIVPQCNPSVNELKENRINFLLDHYSDAKAVADANSVPVDWILGWSALESGSYQAPYGTYWGNVKQVNWHDNSFFGQTGKGWDGQQSCVYPVTNTVGQTYACFDSFQASASAALTSFDGRYGAALTFAASAGASANAAFYEVAALGYYGNPEAYGKTIAGIILGAGGPPKSGVGDLLDCLKKYGYIE